MPNSGSKTLLIPYNHLCASLFCPIISREFWANYFCPFCCCCLNDLITLCMYRQSIYCFSFIYIDFVYFSAQLKKIFSLNNSNNGYIVLHCLYTKICCIDHNLFIYCLFQGHMSCFCF